MEALVVWARTGRHWPGWRGSVVLSRGDGAYTAEVVEAEPDPGYVLGPGYDKVTFVLLPEDTAESPDEN